MTALAILGVCATYVIVLLVGFGVGWDSCRKYEGSRRGGDLYR